MKIHKGIAEMTDREKFILRAALIYVQANLDDVNLVFEHEGSADDPENEQGLISVNGDEREYLNEVEVAELLFTLQ
jgi:hypothetical protein